MSNPFFDMLNDLSFGKRMILSEDNEKAYTPFIINEIYSRFPDSIMYAEEMNCRPSIPKKMHYLFMMHSMRKRKRFGKMPKGEKHEHFDTIKDYYKYSDKRTEEVLDVLTPVQIDNMVKLCDKGGRK